jgi:FkbM family methyltransferase
MASAQVVKDLIYDVGMHNGDDSAFYLHQGFRVIAIEADPRLVEAAKRRFRGELTSGRLTILNVGVAETAGKGTFWICEGMSAWNSFHEKISSRLGEKHHAIEIETRTFRDILDECGVPLYLKIDIEGNDALCIRDLAGRLLPPFISVEAENTGDNEDLSETEALENLSLLYDAGYRRFKLISQYDFTPELYSDIAVFSQRILNSAVNGRLRAPGLSVLAKRLTYKDWLWRKHRYQFPYESSGPWGEGTPARWLSFEQAKAVHKKARERHFKKPNFGKFSFWCDWHART